MIDYKRIDKAFDFYNINVKYKNKCYDCIKKINNSDIYIEVFNKVYKKLYYDDFSKLRQLWDVNDINELFINNIDPFVTNVMILLGCSFHISNIDKYKLNDKQVIVHKKRVKECFESDIESRGYEGVRISQMLWAIYFIRVRIIEVGRLQFEQSTKDDRAIIKIHIPKDNKLDIHSVKKSLNDSKIEIEKIFKLKNYQYICNSWLLSNQLYKIIDKDTNISKFHKLFNVDDGENCINDILNFVFEIDKCDNYSLLPEKTSLQKKIKEQLLNGKEFYLGLGILENL